VRDASTPAGDLDGTYALPEDARRELEAHGHLTLRAVLTPTEVAALRAGVQRALAVVPALVPTEAEGEAYARAFRQHTNLWRADQDVARSLLSPRLAGIAARLLGVAGVRVYHDQALFKLPGGAATPWHQDKHYWPVDAEMLTLWLALVDVTPEMGELRFARGTHRLGAVGDRPISAQSQAELSEFVRRRGDAVVGTGPMRAGDASLHLAWTLHGSGPNDSAVCREAMTVIFMPDGARVLAPTNAGQRTDLETWLPGLRPGDVAASPLNPLCRAALPTP